MISARTPLLLAAALVATLALASCAGTATTDTAASSDAAAFNDADVTFAQMMIPHHEQAVEMSDDLLAKDGIDPAVVTLATEIKAAQEPEITQLKDWLTEWNADENSMSGMGDGSDGMMSADDMTALQDASGSAASELFLEQMTAHHEGAVAMAQIEVDNGSNADAQALAANIIATQTAEIAVMADLLQTR